ncbi:MAG: hypothetical protein IT289_08365 [Oligoflexia bacterium]|nr:hypothetical protein [Oligoflexia bacterium]
MKSTFTLALPIIFVGAIAQAQVRVALLDCTNSDPAYGAFSIRVTESIPNDDTVRRRLDLTDLTQTPPLTFKSVMVVCDVEHEFPGKVDCSSKKPKTTLSVVETHDEAGGGSTAYGFVTTAINRRIVRLPIECTMSHWKVTPIEK